jgi:hypothetical protein
MGKTVMGAVVSLDGFIADADDDGVGPLFDWYGNGDVTWPSRAPTTSAGPPRPRPTSCGASTATWRRRATSRPLELERYAVGRSKERAPTASN